MQGDIDQHTKVGDEVKNGEVVPDQETEKQNREIASKLADIIGSALDKIKPITGMIQQVSIYLRRLMLAFG